MAKFHLAQQVHLPTRDKEILDLVWSSNPDLVSNTIVDTFSDISDHSVVTATTSFSLSREADKEEVFLLESGRRLRQLDFSKAPWPKVRARLAEVDWGPMEDAAEHNVTAAHDIFMDNIILVLEDLVPVKKKGKRFGKRYVDKRRRCLWRKLGRVKKRILSSSSAARVASLLQRQHVLEKELQQSYTTQGWEEEDEVVRRIKDNP